MNSRLLAEVLRQIGSVTRNDELLRASGLTHEEAVLEIDSLIWEGPRSAPWVYDEYGVKQAQEWLGHSDPSDHAPALRAAHHGRPGRRPSPGSTRSRAQHSTPRRRSAPRNELR